MSNIDDVLDNDDDDDDDDVILDRNCIPSKSNINSHHIKGSARIRRKVSIKMPDGEDSDDENSEIDNDVDFGIPPDDVKMTYIDDIGSALMSPQSKPTSPPPSQQNSSSTSLGSLSPTTGGHSRLQMTAMMANRAAAAAAAVTPTKTGDASSFVQSGVNQQQQTMTAMNSQYSLYNVLKNFIPIDRFFGFYHYYHNNKDHALSWWRNYCL